MTLLEQLRDIRRQPQGPTYKALHELCGEAADEIERLTAALDSVRQWDSLYDALPDKLAQQIVAALAPR